MFQSADVESHNRVGNGVRERNSLRRTPVLADELVQLQECRGILTVPPLESVQSIRPCERFRAHPARGPEHGLAWDSLLVRRIRDECAQDWRRGKGGEAVGYTPSVAGDLA